MQKPTFAYIIVIIFLLMNFGMINNIVTILEVCKFIKVGYNVYGVGQTVSVFLKKTLAPQTVYLVESECHEDSLTGNFDFIWIDKY